MLQFTIKTKHLRAARLFAGTDKTRKVVMGVLVSVEPFKQIILVGTGGHRMIRFIEKGADCPETSGEGRFVIPSDMIDQLKTAIHPRVAVSISLQKDGEADLTLSCGHLKIERKITIYDFQFERIIEKAEKETAPCDLVGFNAAYLGDFHKIHKTLGNKNVGIKIAPHADTGGAIVRPIVVPADEEDYYFAVVMQMRV